MVMERPPVGSPLEEALRAVGAKGVAAVLALYWVRTHALSVSQFHLIEPDPGRRLRLIEELERLGLVKALRLEGVTIVFLTERGRELAEEALRLVGEA